MTKKSCLRETNIGEMIWGDGGETTRDAGGMRGGGGEGCWTKRRRVKIEAEQLGWKRLVSDTSYYLIKYTGRVMSL